MGDYFKLKMLRFPSSTGSKAAAEVGLEPIAF